MAREITSSVVIRINDKQVVNSFNGIRSEVIRLERELKKLTPGTEEFRRKAAEVKEARRHFESVKQEIDAVNGKLKQSEGFIGKFRSKLADFGIGFSQILIGFGAAKIGQTATELLKISDAMADVQKTTGMALEEVKGLWEAFDGFDTRTQKIDLLKIAEEAGRLNVPKEQMVAFVQEIDKVFVALGDSYEGGLQQIVGDIGKMKNLFQETVEQDYATAINGIGSALNALAANGVASEKNIADFTMRVGALPNALKPSIDKVLGLGAAFEESGIDSQIAASGYSNFMKVAGENLQKFAYSMNMSYAEAQKLFNEKPEEFFLRFAEGMRGVPAEQTAKIFDSLKIGTLEVQKAVGAAANNTEKFRQSMREANVEMSQGTSITNEFNTKNNNAAAIWEKLKNAISDIFTKTNVINWFENVIHIIGWFTGVTKEAGNGVVAFKEKLTFFWNIIKVATVAILGYNASVLITTISTGNLTKATWLSIMADKAKTAGMVLKRVVLLAYNVVLGLVTLNINRARIAMMAFNVTAKANPFGVLITLVTTAYIAYQSFSKEVDEVTRKQKEFNDINTEANKGIISQKNELENLLKVAKDETASKEARLAAIKKLNEISPEYLGFLNSENINTQAATNAVNAYTEALYRASKIRVLKKKQDEKMEAYEDQKRKSVVEGGEQKDWLWKATGGFLKLTSSEAQNLDKNMFKQMEIWTKRGGKEYAKAMMQTYGHYYEARQNELNKAKKEIDEIGKEIHDLSITNPSIINDNPNIIAPDGKGKNTNRPAKDNTKNDNNQASQAHEKAKSDTEKYQKELLDIKRKYKDEELQMLKESEEKEKALEQEKHLRELEDIQNHNREKEQQQQKLSQEIQDLEVQKNKKGTSEKAKTEYQKAIDEKKQAQDKITLIIEENLKLKEKIEENHQIRISAIEKEWEMKRYEHSVQTEMRAIAQQRTVREKEINDLENLESAKILLKSQEIQQLYALSKDELAAITSLEDAKKALREAYDREALQATQASVKKEIKAIQKLLKDPKLSPQAVKTLNENLAQAEEYLQRLRGESGHKKGDDEERKKEERKSVLSQVDILGFSAAQWEETFKKLNTTQQKLEATKMVVQGMSNAFQQFYQLQKNLGDAELKRFTRDQDTKKTHLLRQLNQGKISQEQYHKGVQQLEEETDAKKREIAQRQAKAEKIAKMFSVVANTSVAIMQAYSQLGPIGGTIAAAIIGTLGAIQLATINSQPLPEYAEGGYTGKGTGKPDRTGFRPAGIVHENEYVTPKWMLQNPVVADVVDWMESVRTGKAVLPKPFAEGGFTKVRTSTQQEANTPHLESHYTISEPLLTTVMGEVRDLLSDLKANGVEAWMVEDAENGKRMKRTIKMFEKIESRNRIR